MRNNVFEGMQAAIGEAFAQVTPHGLCEISRYYPDVVCNQPAKHLWGHGSIIQVCDTHGEWNPVAERTDAMTVKQLRDLLNEIHDGCQVVLSKDKNVNSPVRAFGFGVGVLSPDGATIAKVVGGENETHLQFNAVILFPL